MRTPDPSQVQTVSDLTASVRELLEQNLGEVWVVGEISNFRKQSSGHAYFTLKDDRAQLAAVLFKGAGALVPFRLADGQQVVVRGEITVYEAQGKYQIIVRQMLQKGLGDLQARFEALKQKLNAEGLFDQSRKKSLPRFPETVAVVTSPTGAALQDMLNILRRRAPQMRVFVCPVRVQGAGSADEIVCALETLARWKEKKLFSPDAVIVARGGGSLEDLWSFNEEKVVRAIAASPFPILTGIGHEIDFTLSDFAADLRAPTPSAAAEMLVQDRAETLGQVHDLHGRLDSFTKNYLSRCGLHLRRLAESVVFREPARVVELFQQRVDDLHERLLSAPQALIQGKRHSLVLAGLRLEERSPTRFIERGHAHLKGLEGRLNALNPHRVLERGYALVRRKDGQIARSAKSLVFGERVTICLVDGEAGAVIGQP